MPSSMWYSFVLMRYDLRRALLLVYRFVDWLIEENNGMSEELPDGKWARSLGGCLIILIVSVVIYGGGGVIVLATYNSPGIGLWVEAIWFVIIVGAFFIWDRSTTTEEEREKAREDRRRNPWKYD